MKYKVSFEIEDIVEAKDEEEAERIFWDMFDNAVWKAKVEEVKGTHKLYYHKTNGGAEYLCSTAIEGTNEGSFNSKYIIRIDGDVEKDAELNIKE